jgi:hypothetical protein
MKAALIHSYGSNDAVSVADIDIQPRAPRICWFEYAASANPVGGLGLEICQAWAL